MVWNPVHSEITTGLSVKKSTRNFNTNEILDVIEFWLKTNMQVVELRVDISFKLDFFFGRGYPRRFRMPRRIVPGLLRIEDKKKKKK